MKVIDTYNAIVGAAVAVLSYIFGEHWILFALFLAFMLPTGSQAGGSLWGICSVCGDWKDAWR